MLYRNNVFKIEMTPTVFFKIAHETNYQMKLMEERLRDIMGSKFITYDTTLRKFENYFTTKNLKRKDHLQLYQVLRYSPTPGDLSCDALTYHAMDSTGLSYGFIYGPINNVVNKEIKKSRFLWSDNFYGTNGEKPIDCFDCIDIFESTKYRPNLNSVIVDQFRQDFLPLPMYNFEKFYYKAEDYWGVRTYGPAIVRNELKSSYIPFKQIIEMQLGFKDYNVGVNIVYSKKTINLEIVHNYFLTRFESITETFQAKIAYLTFEFLTVEKVNEHRFSDR